MLSATSVDLLSLEANCSGPPPHEVNYDFMWGRTRRSNTFMITDVKTTSLSSQVYNQLSHVMFVFLGTGKTYTSRQKTWLDSNEVLIKDEASQLISTVVFRCTETIW